MVLEVVAEVEVEDVPKSDVIVGLLAFDELVVLGNDVNGSWMRANWAQPSHKQEQQRPLTPNSINYVVSEEDECIVQNLVSTQTGILHKDGPKCVEQLNDRVEQIFVPLVLVRKLRFPHQWQVRISQLLAKEVVMIWVVFSKRKGRRNGHGDVA